MKYRIFLDYNSRPVIELMIVVDSAFMAKYSEMSIRGGVTLYLMTLLSMMANLYRLRKNKGPDVSIYATGTLKCHNSAHK